MPSLRWGEFMTALLYQGPGEFMAALQGLLEIKDTHRPRALRWGWSLEHRTTLGALCVLNFE